MTEYRQTPGALAYEAYQRAHDPGMLWPSTWETLPRMMQHAWEAAAQAVLDACQPQEERR